jgi:hypothetical protein
MRPLCHVDMTAWSFSNREDSKFSHCQKENQYVDSDRIAIFKKKKEWVLLLANTHSEQWKVSW